MKTDKKLLKLIRELNGHSTQQETDFIQSRQNQAH